MATKSKRTKRASKTDAGASAFADALHKSLAPDMKLADDAMAAMPAKLTREQKRFLRAKAAEWRLTGKKTAKAMNLGASFFEQIAKRRNLSSADRRELRHRLAIYGTLQFVKLGGAS